MKCLPMSWGMTLRACAMIPYGLSFLLFLGEERLAAEEAPHAASKEEPIYRMMRREMVENQLRARGLRSETVLEVMEKVPRHLFVPDALRDQAYADAPLPIGHDQTISQPYIVAFMTEMLEVEKGNRVLEIGTGSGYQAAVLAELAQEVYTIEILEPLYHSAKERVGALGYRNVHFRRGDGWLGWPEASPFDKIMVTAAAKTIPEALVRQLKEGGRMILPLGEGEFQYLVIGAKRKGSLEMSQTIPVRFVPLVHAGEKKGEGAEDEEEVER